MKSDSAASSAPYWSVMIPTYNPSDLLLATVESVLTQVSDPSRFQIVVVDDCSSSVDVADKLLALPAATVEIHRNDSNLGLAGNWNRCIELSRGEWVHILHQDDLVRPGYYAAMEDLARRFPAIGMAFSRHEHLRGDETTLSVLEMTSVGVLDDWLARLSEYQRLQCPSVSVRRSTYQRVGLFSEEFYYALDWEMWARIAKDFSVGYTPQVLAAYRYHNKSETFRLNLAGTTIKDEFAVARRINGYLPARRRAVLWRKARRVPAMRSLRAAEAAIKSGQLRAAASFLYRTIRMDITALPIVRPLSRLVGKVAAWGSSRNSVVSHDPLQVAAFDTLTDQDISKRSASGE